MCLRVGGQDSQFGPILARFMDYYSLFWGPGVISTIDKNRGVFRCWSPTPAVLADSSPFRGLLFIDLVSLNDYHESRILGYVLRAGHENRSFARF